MDIVLRGDKFLLIDGSIRSDPSCGPLTPIPGWVDRVSKTYEHLKGIKSGSTKQSMAMKLDGGRSLVCHVDSVREGLRHIADSVKQSIGL